MHLFRTIPCLAGALAALSTGVCAQTETSPKGYLQKEGNASFSTFGYYNQSMPYVATLAQVDDSLRGAPRRISTLLFRRDGQLATNSSYAARKLKMTIRMGHADYAKIRPNFQQPDSEYLLGVWQAVLDTEISLPDLSAKPATGTAPFSVRLPLTAPFDYYGSTALAIQIRAGKSDLPSNYMPYPIDSIHLQVASASAGIGVGQGCTVTGRTAPMAHWLDITSYGAKGQSKLAIAVEEAPANAAVLQLLGTSDPDLALGACARLRCQPILTLITPVGDSGNTQVFAQFPHDDAFIGLVLYSQSVAFDAGQPGLPYALSNGYKSIYPKNPLHGVACALAGGVTPSSVSWPDFAFGRGAGVVMGID